MEQNKIINNLSNNSIGQTMSNVVKNAVNNASNVVGTTINKAINNTSGNGGGNIITNNAKIVVDGLTSNVYILSLFLFLVALGLIMFYFLSKSFRVSQALSYMKIYNNYQTLSSVTPNSINNFKLSDFYVCSSFHSAHSGYQILDYVSLEMILANLKTGARFMEFSIFNDSYGKDSEPVVSSGYQVGEWKLTANTIPFDDVCNIIANNAFKVNSSDGGVYNPKDPFFIALNLKNNYQISTLDKIYNSIRKHFAERLLPSKYSYSKRNLGDIKLKDLLEKVIIFASNGHQGSMLEELVNYCWDGGDLNRYHFNKLEDIDGLIEHNRTKLTIVYPHEEGDFMTTNYDPIEPWKLGCQFVEMNFHKIDSNMDKYIEKFKNKSFILKPPHLRSEYKS